MSNDTEARLAAIEARAAIWELVVRYAAAVDSYDYPALEGMFTADTEFISSTGETFATRAVVIDFLRDRAATDRWRVHTPTSLVLDRLDDAAAEGTVNGFAARALEDGSQMFFALRYDDAYVRDDGVWRFARRRVHDVRHLAPPR